MWTEYHNLSSTVTLSGEMAHPARISYTLHGTLLGHYDTLYTWIAGCTKVSATCAVYLHVLSGMDYAGGIFLFEESKRMLDFTSSGGGIRDYHRKFQGFVSLTQTWFISFINYGKRVDKFLSLIWLLNLNSQIPKTMRIKNNFVHYSCAKTHQWN